MLADQVTFSPIMLPGFHGDIQAAFLNNDPTRASSVVLLRLTPGALLQKHYHPSIIEAVYVVEGELINNGQYLPAGSFMAHRPGVVHGPHTTETGCTLMFIQPRQVGPEDSVFVD